jgi:hypothetical protein
MTARKAFFRSLQSPARAGLRRKVLNVALTFRSARADLKVGATMPVRRRGSARQLLVHGNADLKVGATPPISISDVAPGLQPGTPGCTSPFPNSLLPSPAWRGEKSGLALCLSCSPWGTPEVFAFLMQARPDPQR